MSHGLLLLLLLLLLMRLMVVVVVGTVWGVGMGVAPRC
jgi:hypothetical protein